MERKIILSGKVIVIGSGLGGLSAGITLQSKGFDVTIIDENVHTGGKMMPVDENGFHFDFGPNTITMPDIFRRVINDAGGDADRYFRFTKLTKHTKNVFPDGRVLFQSTDPEEMKESLSAFGDGERYEAYLKEVRRLYDLAEKGFFYRVFNSWRDYLSPSLSAHFAKVRPLEKMDHFHRRFFRHADVLKVFNRYATYIGSSPYQCPATFSLIGHLEMNDGVYYTQGGNTGIAKGFSAFFKEHGGVIRSGTKVKKILVEGREAKGILTSSGDEVRGDYVIVNGDYITATKELLDERERPSTPDRKLDAYEPSISAFVILAGLREFQADIHHHQVFFTDDYKEEFDDIFNKKRLPKDPTIYISHSAATDPGVTKGSNLFILVNAPAVNLTEEEAKRYKNKIYDALEQKGIPIRSQLEYEKVMTPDAIKGKFSAYRGALYGIASHTMTEAFLRPSNVSRDVRNLFYAGGTTHPGGGSPMVTISGKNVADFILTRHGKR